MKIAIYIIKKNAKQAYKKECFDIRVNAGLMVVKDILNRKGYDVDYCSSANVHKYDVILFNITSDCDFWAFIAERVKWQKGNYKVVLGGAGVLNVRPFLTVADYFVLGRAENVIAYSKKNPAARRYLELPLACNLISYGNNVVASIESK